MYCNHNTRDYNDFLLICALLNYHHLESSLVSLVCFLLYMIYMLQENLQPLSHPSPKLNHFNFFFKNSQLLDHIETYIGNEGPSHLFT